MEIKSCLVMLLHLALLVPAGSSSASSQLEVGYYSKTCPNAEAIVRDEMKKIISAAPSLAGPLLRLHFHDCFVRVDAVVADFSTKRHPLIFVRVNAVVAYLHKRVHAQRKIAGL
jgi:hypothetical protein